MRFFTATIYKAGINPCVDVPSRITDKMQKNKGYIPVKGKINSVSFVQTLVPVKHSFYRLFVNGSMMKGAEINVGDEIKVSIEEDFSERKQQLPELFEKILKENKVFADFKKLLPSRQKEILSYLNYLKTEEALVRNSMKVVRQLQKKNS